MKMYKAISLLGLFGVVGNAYSVQMTPQIQKLLDEKAQKVAELEKCDKTRKGFMIAGISTLGLTAVGIGGNIALANKNKKLDAELTDKKSELASKKKELSSLQSQQIQSIVAQQLKLQKEACDAKDEPYQWTANGECRVLYDETKVLRILKSKNEKPSITKEEFCNLKGQASEFDEFINQDNYDSAAKMNDFWSDVNKLADFGFWCRHSGGDWTVSAEGHGWRCSCKNIPDVACGGGAAKMEIKGATVIKRPDENPKSKDKDWSVLNGSDSEYGVTKEDFCKEAAKGEVKGIISVSLSNASFLFAQQRAVGYRYWCSYLKGSWSISEDQNGDKVWTCEQIPDSACGKVDPLGNRERSIMGNEMMEEEVLFLSNKLVAEKPDNKLCTDSGGVYVFGKCKCSNYNMKLSSNGKRCDCINDTVFNEKTKHCDVVKDKNKPGEKEVAQELAKTEQLDMFAEQTNFIMGSENTGIVEMVSIPDNKKTTTTPAQNVASNNDNQNAKQIPKQETEQKLETKDAFASIEAMKKEFDDRNKALADGTAEGYIYFFVIDKTGGVITNSHINCDYTIDDGNTRYSGNSFFDCTIGTGFGQVSKCHVQDLPDEATCWVSSSGYKSKQVTVRDLRSGMVQLDK